MRPSFFEDSRGIGYGRAIGEAVQETVPSVPWLQGLCDLGLPQREANAKHDGESGSHGSLRDVHRPWQ